MQGITDDRYEYHGAAATPLEDLLERACATLTEHDAQYPNRTDTQYHLGVCLDAMDEHAGATVCVNLALRINPRYASAQWLALQIFQAESSTA